MRRGVIALRARRDCRRARFTGVDRGLSIGSNERIKGDWGGRILADELARLLSARNKASEALPCDCVALSAPASWPISPSGRGRLPSPLNRRRPGNPGSPTSGYRRGLWWNGSPARRWFATRCSRPSTTRAGCSSRRVRVRTFRVRCCARKSWAHHPFGGS